MKAEQPINMIMVGDFGKDLDDENALLYAVGAGRSGQVNLLGVVANLEPAETRARLAKGMLEYLGVDAPVGIGTSCNTYDVPGSYEMDVPYLSEADLPDGQTVIGEALENAPDKSVTLVLNSGLTDAEKFAVGHPRLFRRKVAKVAIMGGVQNDGHAPTLDEGGRMRPDDAANNQFDRAAAETLYAVLQIDDVPSSTLTREAAYACQFDMRFYERLAETDTVIGQAIHDRQRPAIEHLWEAVHAPVGSSLRGSLPARCDRQWFVATYLGGNEPMQDEDIWTAALLEGSFQLYDPLNVASVVRPDYFKGVTVRANKPREAEHTVIGLPDVVSIPNGVLLRSHVEATILDSFAGL